MTKRPRIIPFKDLEAHWYKKLKSSGFEDIESQSHPDRPLKSWHSRVFVSDVSLKKRQKRSGYQAQIDDFANHPDLLEILQVFVKHKNSIFDEKGIMQIWELHRYGFTERGIAKEMHCSRSCITFILKRLREWMQII